MKNNATLTVTGIPVVATLFAGAILASSVVVADDVVDQINITVPISCSMSGTGMTSHNAEIQNGTYTADIGSTVLHAFCNDSEGFAIYAAGYTGDEIGGTNSNKLVGTSTSGNSVIETGLATSVGNPDVSNWAMKLTMTQDSGDTTGTNAFTIDSAPNVALPSQAESGTTEAPFSSYHVVPNEYTKVAHKNSATDMTATTGGVKLTTTYAAYISKTQAADTYSGQVIYTLVHPASANAEGCNPSGTTISTILCMQDVSSSNKSTILTSMTEGTQYTLKDKRDGKTYTVSKLADGNIWMTQNLDLDLDSSRTYTNLDTDLGWNGSNYGTASWTPAHSTNATSITVWNGSNISPESYNPGDLYWNGEAFTSTDQVSSVGIPQYHLGNYYNWTAAAALNDSSLYPECDEYAGDCRNRIVEQSICPTGWTLPKDGEEDGENGSFRYLIERYGWDDTVSTFIGSFNSYSAPMYFNIGGGVGGYIGSGDVKLGVGNSSWYWSRDVDDGHDAYTLYLDTTGGDYDTMPYYDDWRAYGYSVRCVAR